MKNLFILIAFFTYTLGNAQIITGKEKEDISSKVEMFEIWAFKKPFSQKEVYFINYGQKKFKPSNYDLLGQGVYNDNGEKFEKGEWLSLVQYLDKNGFEKQDERPETIGNIEGRIITFKKK